MSFAARRAAVDPIDAARAWLDAAAALPDAGLSVWTSRIGGVPIRFRCTHTELAHLYRSRLAGTVQEPDCPCDIQLDLLETERLGWSVPGAGFGWRHDTAVIERRFADERISALMPRARDAESGYPWVFFDPSSQRGLMLVRTAADLPPWSAGAPFALLLHFAFAWRGWRFVHAATLGSDRAGALLAGPGGSGKSGTALAGVMDGLMTVGDDYLVVEPGATPVAWPAYRLLKQDSAGLARVGLDRLAGQPANWNGKVELDLEAEFPGRLAGSLDLTSILLPEVANAARTSIVPAAPTDAFSAIAGSMLAQLPGARIAGFSFLTQLTRALPAYHLRLSSDPQEIAASVREVLER